tara:strand:- start:14495 stop:16540 length:2046 start_codon:yes stop_codon:yes gene_type:complete
MCGIAGIFHHDPSQRVNPQTLVHMAAIQHHRGPDGFGYETFDDRGIGFSHARLSIIDLNERRARQPFVSDDGRLLMAHNGEFYDFKRIRADLTSRGERFRSKSDSEIMLHLYRRYGLDEALKHLRGEFAFALYDREEDTLYLVRDRFGIKPLYWCPIDDGVLFGSEVKTIMADPRAPRAFDNEGLFHQLIQVMVPGTTAFKGIYQVKPGHVLKIRRCKDGAGRRFEIEDRPYWDLDFPHMTAHQTPMSEEEAVETVRAKLLEAVQLRLEADVPVGCYLSGGIDSCSILGLASAARQDSVKAFTISFDDKDYDESPIAREMAEATGADQDILLLKGDDLYGHLEKTLWHTERTIYNTLAVAKFLMSKHVHEVGYKVVVTGEGSDELFAGYPSFRKDLYLHGLPELGPEEKKAWQNMLTESNALFRGAMLAETDHHDAALDERVGFTPSCLQPWLSCADDVWRLLHKDRAASLSGYAPGKAIADTLDEEMLKDRHPLDRAQYVWAKTMLEGQILTWGGDRVDMANSMEARPAFLDHHLAEAAVKIPPLYRIKERKEKYVLREAMKGLLPKVLYEREKFAFMAPPSYRDEGKWSAMMKLARDHLTEERVAETGLLDYDGVQNIIAGMRDDSVSQATKTRYDALMNHMLGVQILHQHFIATDVPALAASMAQKLGWSASPKPVTV